MCASSRTRWHATKNASPDSRSCTDTQTASRIDCGVTQVAGRAAGSAEDDPIPSTAPPTPVPRVSSYISLSAGRSPENFANQRGPRVILGVNREITGADASLKSCPSRKHNAPGELFTQVESASMTPLQPIPIRVPDASCAARLKATKSRRAGTVRGEDA